MAESGSAMAPGYEPIPCAWVASEPVDVVGAAQRWLDSAALRRLIVELGGPDFDAQDLTALKIWSAKVLDTRRGAERRDAVPVRWTTGQIQALLAAAGPLGLLETAGLCRESYEVTILLGGATTGNRLRTALARDLVNRGVDLGMLVAVTAERSLSDREYATDPESVQDRTEWVNLLRNLRDAFGPFRVGSTTSGGSGGAPGQDREFTTAAGLTLRVLVAPPRSARRRATTTDGMRFFLECIPCSQRRHVLIVTSAIYAPYQFFTGAPIALSDGAEHVELVGTPTGIGGDANLLAQRIAQEIHAAVNATAGLLHP